MNLRMIGMILACGVLGYLVWLDNFARESEVAAPSIGHVADPEPASPLEAADDAAPGFTNANQDDTEFSNDVGAEDDRAANPLSSVEIDILSDTVERPLFASSRRRPPPKDDASETIEETPATFELLGVVVNGARATAVLKRIESAANYNVAVGDSLSGWKVAQINPTSVVLEGADGAVQTIEIAKK